MTTIEDLVKRAAVLFPKPDQIDPGNTKIFLDKKRWDIQNQAKQLVNDIDEIINCLKTYHRNGNVARIAGHTAGTGEDHRSLTETGTGHPLVTQLEQLRITVHFLVKQLKQVRVIVTGHFLAAHLEQVK